MLNMEQHTEGRWHEFIQACTAHGLEIPKDHNFGQAARNVFISSRFVHNSCLRDPELILDLHKTGRLTSRTSDKDYSQLVEKALEGSSSLDDMGIRLRRLRRMEMVRIAWRDIARLAGLQETMKDLTAFASACLTGTLKRLYDWMVAKLGRPELHDGRPPGLTVIGMGKLGGGELNFSSDIDLMFAHPGPGNTAGGSRIVSNDEFFTRLARQLISSIGSATSEGLVFRVDTRLRPFGEGGPLVTGTDAMEDYYENFGRDWERYALIKARAVAGDLQTGQRILERLRPFVYKRYLDYEMFDSLRSMKSMIEAEMARKGLRDHIKLGRGGIREVEFICQVFQLIRGGRLPELQEPGTLNTLRLIASHKLMPEETCQDLFDAYCFLRTLEHRLQEYDDQQTHKLPADPFERHCVALSMGYKSYEDLYASLEQHRNRVHEHFSALLAPGGAKQAKTGDHSVFIWQNEEETAARALENLGFREPGKISSILKTLSHGKTSKAHRGMERLNQLIPVLIKEAAQTSDPDKALARVVKVIESIGRRPCYLSLLAENPKALSHLAGLCLKSAWITDMLSRHPILLDELLSPSVLYFPMGKEDLSNELKGLLARIPANDLELMMDEMRRFRQANMLRVAAADLIGALDVRESGERLTQIAEVVLEEVVQQAWDHLSKRHGIPETYLPCDAKKVCGTAVIGYGKLGGVEMGYGSDLDLVFLHSASPGGKTNGPLPLDSGIFYSRHGQRIIHMLTTHTSAGILYPVDMRLRPDGASGVLITSLSTFSEYQLNKAWTWEHQALIRARAICGDEELSLRFQDLRASVLQKKRDIQDLKQAVSQMRTKIIKKFIQKENQAFDIKHHPGGLIDIEFLVQFTVLAKAHECAEVAGHTNVLDLLCDFRDFGLMDPEDVEVLEQAYRSFMSAINRFSLDQQPPVSNDPSLKKLRDSVLHVWGKNMNLKEN